MLKTKKITQDKPILTISNLNVFFKSKGYYLQAVNDVSFQVNQGDFFGIVGESGSGKSTIAKCLVKLVKPTAGRIEIDNNLLTNKRFKRRTKKWLTKNVQMIFQDPLSSLNYVKNVLQIVSEPLVIDKSLYKEAFLLWRKTNDIARYFFGEFISQNIAFTYDFQLKYLTLINKIYQNQIDQINQDLKNFKNQNQTTFSFIRAHLINHYDIFIAQLQTAATQMYQFLDDYKALIKKYEQKYDQKEFAAYFLAKSQAYQNFQNAKMVKNYGLEGIELYQKRQKAKKAYQSYLKEFQTRYKKNKQDLKNWYYSIKDKEKSTKYNYYFSKDDFAFSIGFFHKQKTKALLFLITKMQKNSYLTKEKIKQAIQTIPQMLNDLLNDLKTSTLTLMQAFESQDLIQKKQTICDLASLRKLTKILIDYLMKKKWTYAKAFVPKCLKLLKTNPNFSFLSKTKVETYFALKKQIYQQIFAFLKDVSAVSDAIAKDHLTQKQQHKKIIQAKNMRLQHYLQKYKKSPLYAQHTKAYQQSYQQYHLAKQKAQENFKQTIHQAQSTLKQAKVAKAKKVKILVKEYLQKQHQHFKQVKLFVHLIKQQQTNKKILAFYKTKETLKKELLLRQKSLKAFAFEYKKTINFSRIFTFIFNTPRFLNWIIMFSFLTILKRDKVYAALSDVGLKREHVYRYPHEFSGGQRQRIAIARALISEPKIIVADEPISALDVSIQAQIINIFQELVAKKKVTILLIAHDLSVVHYVCNKVIIMHRGKILEKGDTNHVFENPIHPYTQSLIKATPKLVKAHVDLAAFYADFDYDQDYSSYNKPSFYRIQKDLPHYVFGTQKQVKTWIKTSQHEN